MWVEGYIKFVHVPHPKIPLKWSGEFKYNQNGVRIHFKDEGWLLVPFSNIVSVMEVSFE